MPQAIDIPLNVGKDPFLEGTPDGAQRPNY
jgi:hypothetical protein